MEVHHSQHPTHKKKWHEYLLEFLMLFLAVFLGFLAENFREHQVEKRKTKEFMHTMVGNLRYDSTRCANNFKNNEELQEFLDSFRVDLSSAIKGNINTNKLYYDYLRIGKGLSYAAFNTSALTQLQSSGTLRLIKNDELTNEIMDYYNRRIRTTERFFDEGHQALLEYLESCKEFFNSEYFVNAPKRTGDNTEDSIARKGYAQTFLSMQPAPELLKTRPEELNRLYNDVAGFEENSYRYNYMLDLMRKQATILMGRIKAAYNLE